MKTLGLLAAALAVAFTTAGLAQDTAKSPADTLERPAAEPQTNGSGTAPHGIGSTGWTGGSRSAGAETSGQGSPRPDPEAADQQPEMATGADLKGPAQRFPAGQTPE